MRVVGHAHAQVAVLARHPRPRQFLGVLVGFHGVGSKSEADEGLRVVVQQQAGLDVVAIELHRHLHLVGAVADQADQRRAVRWRCARCGQDQCIAIARDAPFFIRAGLMEAPLHAEAFGFKPSRQREASCAGLAAGRLPQRLRQVATGGAEPAVISPLDRFQQGLPAQCAKPMFVTVVDHPPVASRPFHQRGVAARPPRFIGGLRAHQRVARAVFPRAMHRTRTRGDDHVARRWAGGAADRGDQVQPALAPQQLWTFRREVLGDPVLRVAPWLVGVFQFAIGGQAVVAQADLADAVDEQIAPAVFADHVAGIDDVVDAEVDRIAPRPAADVVGPGHEDLPALVARIGGQVNEIAVAVLA